MSEPQLSVIITAWNQLEKTLACLETVVAQHYPCSEILLVDNGSRPELATAVAKRFPQVEIIHNPRNLGFAGGYNAGLRRALAGDAELFCLLNNDTLLASDCLQQLVQTAVARPDVGLVTAKVYYAHDRQRIWTVGNRLRPWLLDITGGGNGQLDQGQWSVTQVIDFAPFCGVLLKRTLIETVGLLDEDFFLYYEDMDYCRRARQAGFRLQLSPAAHIWHDVSASSGGRASPLERYWMAQSSGRYFRKHGRGPRLLLILPFRLGSALLWTVRLAFRRRWRALSAYWWGLAIGWATGRATTPPPRWVAKREI